MTSFTRKLYSRDPAAAEAFHRQQQFEHRITYGKHTQLAGFGLRQTPPPLPSYECWSPMLGYEHRSVLKAPDSYQARVAYAKAHPGMHVTDCCARAIPSELPSR